VNRFLIALQFLTIIPVKIRSPIEEKDLGKSLLYFPVVGMLIGCMLALAVSIFSFLPGLVSSGSILAVSVVITGGIHLDGFADTCDGFYGSNPKERILEIMRDSRSGVMGVTGIVCLLLLKFSLIASLPQDILWKAVIVMAVFARWVQVFACYTSDYARKDGKARAFIEYAGKKELFIGAIFTLALFMFLVGVMGLVILIMSCLCAFLFIYYAKKKIGGMTGDTIGAVSEIAEVAVLFFAVICFGGV